MKTRPIIHQSRPTVIDSSPCSSLLLTLAAKAPVVKTRPLCSCNEVVVSWLLLPPYMCVCRGKLWIPVCQIMFTCFHCWSPTLLCVCVLLPCFFYLSPMCLPVYVRSACFLFDTHLPPAGIPVCFYMSPTCLPICFYLFPDCRTLVHLCLTCLLFAFCWLVSDLSLSSFWLVSHLVFHLFSADSTCFTRLPYFNLSPSWLPYSISPLCLPNHFCHLSSTCLSLVFHLFSTCLPVFVHVSHSFSTCLLLTLHLSPTGLPHFSPNLAIQVPKVSSKYGRYSWIFSRWFLNPRCCWITRLVYS